MLGVGAGTSGVCGLGDMAAGHPRREGAQREGSLGQGPPVGRFVGMGQAGEKFLSSPHGKCDPCRSGNPMDPLSAGVGYLEIRDPCKNGRDTCPTGLDVADCSEGAESEAGGRNSAHEPEQSRNLNLNSSFFFFFFFLLYCRFLH